MYCAEDCRNNSEPVTEIFGSFCLPGWREAARNPRDDDDHAVLAVGFEARPPAFGSEHLDLTWGNITAPRGRKRTEMRRAQANMPDPLPGGQTIAALTPWPIGDNRFSRTYPAVPERAHHVQKQRMDRRLAALLRQRQT